MMKPATTIQQQDWMISPQTKAVMQALGGEDEDPKAYSSAGAYVMRC